MPKNVQYLLFVWLVLLIIVTQSCRYLDKPTDPAHAFGQLLKRQLGEGYKDIQFEIRKDSTHPEWAIVKSVDGIAHLSSNSVSAAAMAFNDLVTRNQAGQFDWTGKRLSLPATWPESGPDTIRTIVPFRWVGDPEWYNTETAYWTWADWEHFLDVMLLNGYNTLLLTEGTEMIWASVWNKLGLPKTVFNGALPYSFPYLKPEDGDFENALQGRKNYFNQKLEIHQKIVRRARDLGIHIVVPVFDGWIPPQLKPLFPSASFISVFDDKSGVLLDRIEYADPLYRRIQGLFFQFYEDLVGPIEYAWISPFQKTPPQIPARPIRSQLELSGLRIMESLNYAGKTPMIFIQTDFLSENPDFWTKDAVSALLKNIPAFRCQLVFSEYRNARSRDYQRLLPAGHVLNPIIKFNQDRGGFTNNTDEVLRRVESLIAGGIQPLSVSGSAFKSTGSDFLSFQFSGLMAWDLAKQNLAYYESICHTRYGACDTGLQLAFQLFRSSMPGTEHDRIQRITGQRSFLYQLTPDLAWATFKHYGQGIPNMHLAARYYLSYLEDNMDNPLFLYDFYEITKVSLSVEADHHLAAFMAALLTLNRENASKHFNEAIAKLELLHRLGLFSGVRGTDEIHQLFRKLEPGKKHANMLFQRFLDRPIVNQAKPGIPYFNMSVQPYPTNYYQQIWHAFYYFISNQQVFIKENAQNHLLRFHNDWFENNQTESKRRAIELKDLLDELRQHFDNIVD